MMMDNDLKAVETWAKPLLDNLSPSEFKKLTRTMAVALRQQNIKRIKAQQNPDGTPYEKRKPRLREKKGQIKKRKAMFQKLRKIKHLKIKSDANGLSVGMDGGAAAIAKIHHYGKLARVSKNGVLHKYAVRKLLGLNKADRDLVLTQLQKHISK